MSESLINALNASNRWQKILQYCAFVFILFGVKLALISNYANATPFWDQWDAEAYFLYKPYLDGTIRIIDLFGLHNEHRILTTRLLALGLLELNQLWNPLLQMVINAGLHVLAICLCVSLMVKVIGDKYLKILLIFSIIIFSIPYGWENTLAGFQSQFYFVLLFSMLCIWLIIDNEPLSIYWWLGFICGVLAFLSFASGIIAVAAAASICILQWMLNARKTKKHVIAITILITLICVGVWLTPSIPGHAVYKAASVAQFLDALFGIFSWPMRPGFFKACYLQLPAIVFTGILIFQRPPATDKRWYLLALVAWMFGQAMSIAYGRALSYASSRYLDLFAIGILVNFACILSILQNAVIKNLMIKNVFFVTWLMVVFLTMGKSTYSNIAEQLELKHANSLMQEESIKKYLTSNEISHLQNKPLEHIPYPNAERLSLILQSKNIQNILPNNIKNQNNIATQLTNGRLDFFVRFNLKHYTEYIALGLIFAIYLMTLTSENKKMHLRKY
jgi:hypothetical protein